MRYSIKQALLLLFAIVLMVGSHSSLLARAESTTQPVALETRTPPNDLHDQRYCEVLLVHRKGLKLEAEVYNTQGLNHCPAVLWSQLNAQELAKQHGAMAAKLNGPRYWVMNQIKASQSMLNGKVDDFGGIKMGLRATVGITPSQVAGGEKLYAPSPVKRTTVFTYQAGNKVYELISPQGAVFVMQSYSQMVDPNLTLADLDRLGSRLKLPQGWRYQVRTLKENLNMKADGLAEVIQDDFYNSYQQR